MRTPTSERNHPAGFGGVLKLYRFANGYGARVVRGFFSYGGDEGKWELAVIKYRSDQSDRFSTAYDTPITDAVMGYLSVRSGRVERE